MPFGSLWLPVLVAAAAVMTGLIFAWLWPHG